VYERAGSCLDAEEEATPSGFSMQAFQPGCAEIHDLYQGVCGSLCCF